MPAFWLHYNRPKTQEEGRNVLTVHYRGQCHFVHGVECLVPTRTRERKSQPRMVMAGKGVMRVRTTPGGERIATLYPE